MAYDFLSINPPQIVYKLKDVDETVLHIIPPDKGLVDTLRANLSNVINALTGADAKQRQEIYDLAMHVMNNNRDGVVFKTPKQLAFDYGISLQDIAEFFVKYLDFLNGVEQSKN